jgi:hypothetical protein
MWHTLSKVSLCSKCCDALAPADHSRHSWSFKAAEQSNKVLGIKAQLLDMCYVSKRTEPGSSLKPSKDQVEIG